MPSAIQVTVTVEDGANGGSLAVQYERCTKRMTKLARDYHENLQYENNTPEEDEETHIRKLNQFLQTIPDTQKMNEPAQSPMNWAAKKSHIEEAIHLSKNASAPGMDGCPYELWKKLKAY